MWGGFLLFVFMLLALDLGVFNKKAHTPSMKEALGFTTGAVVLALMFTAFVWVAYHNGWKGFGTHLDAVDNQVNDGRLAAVKFLTGYVIEMSLSMDNVFVIALLFGHLRIPLVLQHRSLLRASPPHLVSPRTAPGVPPQGGFECARTAARSRKRCPC